MTAYLLRRALLAPATIFVVAVIVFALVHLSGSSIELMLLPLDATPAQRAELRQELHLNEPLPIQLGWFLAGATHGDFGVSLYYQRPALAVAGDRIPATFELAAVAIAIAIIVGVGGGILAAVFENSWLDNAVGAISVLGQSVPSFWLGIVMILVFAVNLRWLPTSGMGSLQQLIMPAVSLAAFMVPQFLLLTRASLLDVLHDPYILVAEAKGLSPVAVIFRHALPNAVTPVIASIGLQLGYLMGGAVITEIVFAWPGLGRLGVEAVFNRDLPVIEATVLVLAVGVVVSNLLVDVLTAVADPRIRRG